MLRILGRLPAWLAVMQIFCQTTAKLKLKTYQAAQSSELVDFTTDYRFGKRSSHLCLEK